MSEFARMHHRCNDADDVDSASDWHETVQVVGGCGGVDVLLDLLVTGSSEQVQASAAAALRDLLTWPKAQASAWRVTGTTCHALY